MANRHKFRVCSAIFCNACATCMYILPTVKDYDSEMAPSTPS